MEKKVEIKIQPDGKIDIELIGFEGQGCSKVAAEIVAALGKAIQSNKKPEYYEDNTKGDNCQRNQGY